MERHGRNDPCPCGSGRKLKKCCLPHQAERAAFADVLERLALPLLSRLAKFSETCAGISLESIARAEFPFWGGRVDTERGARVLDHLMFDFRPRLYARRTVEAFIIEVGPTLADDARVLIEQWAGATRRLFRVERWSGGFTTCLDAFEDGAQAIDVFDIEGKWKPVPEEPVALRALASGYAYICVGRPLGFGGRSSDDVVDAIRRRHLDFVRSERIAGIDEYLRAAPKALDEEAVASTGVVDWSGRPLTSGQALRSGRS